MDGTGEQEIDGKPAMKPWWNITENEVEKCLEHTTWGPGMLEYFRGGGYSSTFKTKGGMPITMCRINIVKGIGPVLQIAQRARKSYFPSKCVGIFWDGQRSIRLQSMCYLQGIV